MKPSRPIRWWPAVVVTTAMVVLLAYLWLAPMASNQDRVMPTFPILFIGFLLLFLWLVLFSRLPGRTRWRLFVGVAVIVALVLSTVEIKGVDGNLVPVLGLRWSAERSFEVASVKAADTTGSRAMDAEPGGYPPSDYPPSDYPQFYGPNRDATLPGPSLARDWTTQPPVELWRREVGEGWSAFAVVGRAAVTQEQRGEDEVVVRYDRDSGEQIWVHSDPAPFDTTVGGSGPRATPTIVDDRVYTLGATGILNCLDLASGTKLWTTNVLADNGAGQPEWGMPSSPLVAGDLVIVQLGRRGTMLAAYDRTTGEPAWQADTDSGSYSTPTLAVIAGREQIVSVNARAVTAHDPASGDLLWSAPWDLPGERITPSLQLADDLILVSAGYGVGSRLFRVTRKGEDFEVEQLWESRRLKSKFASMIVHQGVVYGLDDGVLVALDPETGERLWKRGRYGHGQLILVGDLLLIQAEDGDIVLVEATPEEHRELARMTVLDGKTWNPPAISGDLLLVRNNRQAACFRLPLAR